MSSQDSAPSSTAKETSKVRILREITDLEHQLAGLRRDLLSTAQDEATAMTQVDVLTFLVKDKRFGLFLADVVEVLRIVQWSALPKAPPDIQGVINCRGALVPLLNPGLLLSDIAVRPGISASLIVVSVSGQNVALIVDAVEGVQIYSSADVSLVGAEQTVHHTLPAHFAGFVRTDQGHVTILDVSKLLTLEDQKVLGRALLERDEWGQA